MTVRIARTVCVIRKQSLSAVNIVFLYFQWRNVEIWFGTQQITNTEITDATNLVDRSVCWNTFLPHFAKVSLWYRFRLKGSRLNGTVFDQTGLSIGVKLDGPNDWNWTVMYQTGRSKRVKVVCESGWSGNGLRKWTIWESGRSWNPKVDGPKSKDWSF